MPEDYVRSTITDSVINRLNTISQEILSRTRLEKIIQEFNLYADLRKRDELEQVITKKSGIDFGDILSLEPLARGPSGRIYRLRISGTKRSVVVGKELEIRRWLSPSHLYSSAFLVKTEQGERGLPARFTLHGAGWGHGVGLCQIGAAVMSTRGFQAESILTHYFPGSTGRRLY